jgi:hypothetical protein
MTDPLRKPSSGEPFVPSARREAMVIETIQRVQALSQPNPQVGELDGAIVQVRNDTGGDLDADRPVVSLAAPILTPGDRDSVVWERPCFSGQLPQPGQPIAVLLQPLASCAIGRAVITGTTWVQITGSGRFARPIADNTTLLQAGDTGSPIVWQSPGTSVRWAVITLSQDNLTPANPDDPAGDSQNCPDERGASLWRAIDDGGTPGWELVQNGCCEIPISSVVLTGPGSELRCDETTTTTTTTTTSSTTSTTTTTEEPGCCGYDPEPPSWLPTPEQIEAGLEVWACCVLRECTGHQTWDYDVETGEWTADTNECSEGCVAEEPAICPNEDSCTRTQCRPTECTTTTTPDPEASTTTSTTEEPICEPGGSTTTTTSSTTSTTCDPNCIEADGCEHPGDGYEWDCLSNTCSWICSEDNVWVPHGGENGSCAGIGAFLRCTACDVVQVGPYRQCVGQCSPPPLPCECGEIETTAIFPTCWELDRPIPCRGGCVWRSLGGEWHLVRDNCASDLADGCRCFPPSFDPPADSVPGECNPVRTHYATPCEPTIALPPEGGTSDPCDTPSTGRCCHSATSTTPEPTCTGDCVWTWSEGLMDWEESGGCEGLPCECVGRPWWQGDCDGEVHRGFCSDEVTETAPCEGTCHWESDGTQWVLQDSDDCTGSDCSCCEPVYAGEAEFATTDAACHKIVDGCGSDCDGSCTWRFTSGVWSLQSSTCTLVACECEYPPDWVPQTPGSITETLCGGGTGSDCQGDCNYTWTALGWAEESVVCTAEVNGDRCGCCPPAEGGSIVGESGEGECINVRDNDCPTTTTTPEPMLDCGDCPGECICEWDGANWVEFDVCECGEDCGCGGDPGSFIGELQCSACT